MIDPNYQELRLFDDIGRKLLDGSYTESWHHSRYWERTESGTLTQAGLEKLAVDLGRMIREHERDLAIMRAFARAVHGEIKISDFKRDWEAGLIASPIDGSTI